MPDNLSRLRRDLLRPILSLIVSIVVKNSVLLPSGLRMGTGPAPANMVYNTLFIYLLSYFLFNNWYLMCLLWLLRNIVSFLYNYLFDLFILKLFFSFNAFLN